MGVFDGLYCATALSGENEVRWDPQQVWTDLREEKRPLSVIRLLLVGCLTRSLAECDIIIKYVPYYIVSFYYGLREEWKKDTSTHKHFFLRTKQTSASLGFPVPKSKC